MTSQKITIGFVIACLSAVIFTWVFHEFAHWSTSELLGYDTIMRINGTAAKNGENPTEQHQILISIAGPLATLLQALAVFLILKKTAWKKYLYPLLFSAFYMRFLAGLMNFVNLNDEGRVGEFLEIGVFTLPLIVCGFLFWMLYSISKKYQLKLKFQIATLFFVMVTSSTLILSDQFFGIRLL